MPETRFMEMKTTELRLETTESTMETAKQILDNQDYVLVTSKEQTLGKGTRGRPWHGGPGNIYMTVGINRKHLPESRLSLLPLEIGIHLWNEVASQIRCEPQSQLTLKWPNDLMFQGAKVAGILMESHGKFMLIGIGINVSVAPLITDGGSPSGCLADTGLNSLANEKIIAGLYRRIIQAEEAANPSTDSKLSETTYEKEWDLDSILVDWQAKIDWNRVHRLRDRAGQPMVRPIMVNRQGHLQVEHRDGSREWLIADYLA